MYHYYRLMDDDSGPAQSPVGGNDHPWGGTVLRTTIDQPVYSSVVLERFGLDILDMSNALALRILESISARIQAKAEEIASKSTDRNFLSDEDAIVDYYLVNTFSVSFFEATSYLLLTEPLCYKDSQKGESILAQFEDGGEHSWYKVERASTPESKRIEAIIRMQDDFTAYDYVSGLEEFIGVDSSLLETFQELKRERNDVVHNLMGIIDTNWQEANDRASRWHGFINDLNHVAYQELSIHEGLYTAMQD